MSRREFAAASGWSHARKHRASIRRTLIQAYLAQFCVLTHIIAGIDHRRLAEDYVREFFRAFQKAQEEEPHQEPALAGASPSVGLATEKSAGDDTSEDEANESASDCPVDLVDSESEDGGSGYWSFSAIAGEYLWHSGGF